MVSKERSKSLRSMASRCIVTTTLLTALPALSYAGQERSTDLADPCYREITFDTDKASAGGKPAFFQHIWGASDRHPYYRYVGAGYIGVQGNAFEDNFDGTKQWHFDNDNQFHSILSLRYQGNVGDGISVDLDNHDLMAFLFTPRNPETKHFYVDSPIPFVTANEFGQMSGLTTVEDNIEYINGGGAYAFVYESRRNRAFPRPMRFAHHMDGVSPFRILHSQESRVQVAGESRTQTRRCRFAFYPLAATNHDRFRPFIEAELQGWVDDPHADSFVKFGTMSTDHTGDFALTTELGRLTIEFPPSADHSSVGFTRTSNCQDRFGFRRDGTRAYFRGEVNIGGQSFRLPTRNPGQCGFNGPEARSILNGWLSRQDFVTLQGGITVDRVAFIENGSVYDIYLAGSLVER